MTDSRMRTAKTVTNKEELVVKLHHYFLFHFCVYCILQFIILDTLLDFNLVYESYCKCVNTRYNFLGSMRI